MAKKQGQVFWTLMFGGSLIGLGLLMNQVGSADLLSFDAALEADDLTLVATPSPTVSSLSSRSVTSLLAYTQTKTAGQLIAINLESSQRQVVFTDADEKLKLKQIGNLTVDGREALVLLGEATDSFGGSLYSIATNGKGEKNLLISDFASPWPPIFSPDGKKIAYIFFTNTAAETGFSLMIANRDGTNKRELAREARPITQPVFSSDGQSLAYIVEDNSLTGRIVSLRIDGSVSQTELAYTDRVPYDLAWGRDGSFVIVDGTGADADLYLIDPTNPLPVRLPLPSGQESRPLFSPDATTIVYATTTNNETTLATYNRQTGTVTSLGKGLVPLGWLEEKG